MTTMRNSVSLIGFLGSDVQSFTLSTGKKVARARMATNEYYKDKSGERQQRTDWHQLTAWGSLADRMEVLSKGTQLVIEGKLVHRTYTDKDGNKRYASEVVVSGFISPANKTAEAA